MDPGAKYRAVLRWAALVDEVCLVTGEDRWRFAALGFRESRWGDALTPPGDPCGTGDGGHGRGLFQIDDRYHRPFVESPDFRDPKKQALYACKILGDAREWFRKSMPEMPEPGDLERMVYAAYNCGPGSVRRHVLAGEDIDAGTTGRDYSRWISRVAAELKATVPNLFEREAS